jgi:metal-responsive CopG/Arc/MetJ family transcriptional regulator
MEVIMGTEMRKTGVYLEESLLDALDQVGAKLELSRNRVIRMAVRYFLWNYLEGQFDTGQYYEQLEEEKEAEDPGAYLKRLMEGKERD